MRHSSMKSIVVTISIAATLIVVAPPASARSNRGSQVTHSAREHEDSWVSDRITAARNFVSRVLRRIKSNNGMTIPVPAPAPGPSNGQ